MTARLALWIAALSCAAACGCSTRDAANPLDPRNPDTRGEPEWLLALADDEAVDLAWEVPDYDDLREIRVVDADAESLLALGPAGSGAFRHQGLVNGVERRYRLELLLDGGKRLELAPVAATPGREVVWVFEDGSGSLTRLTPDGRLRRLRRIHSDGNAVFADPDSGHALLTEFYSGTVRLLDREGRERWDNDSFLGPLVALRAPGGWWVGDGRAGAVHFLNENGAVIFSDSSFTRVIDLAPAGEHAAWVADRAGAVLRVERGLGVTRRDSSAVEPVAICAAGEGGFWVADRSGESLLRVGAGGRVEARVEDRPGLVALAPDPILPGGVWAADRLRKCIVLFDAAGVAQVEAGGLNAPASLAVAPDGGVVWVADPGLGRVLRIRRDGVTLGRSEPLAYPTALAVVFDPKRPAS